MSTVNDTKENALRSDVNSHSNRILSSIQNHVKHNGHNGFSNGHDADKIKHPIDNGKCQTHVNGHSNHDSSSVVKKFQDDRKSIR